MTAGFPSFEVMEAETMVPFFQSAETSNPPRASRPFTLPSFHWGNTAGRMEISPAWDWTSVSQMPAVMPRLPSIWNGGWVVKRLGRVL